MLLHHAAQGAEQPEAHRPDRALRPRPDRSADRRPVGERRRARGGDDHRGAAQHALRRFACAAWTFVRRHGRGALPRRPDARPGVGGGDPAPARRGAAGQPVGDGQQRRGVRRLDPDRPRRHHRRGRRAPAGAAVATRHGGQAALRPVRLLAGRAGCRREAAGGPRPAAVHRESAGGRPDVGLAGPTPRQRTARRWTRGARAAPVLPAAAATGGDRDAGLQRAAAGDHVRLLAGRLRRRGRSSACGHRCG